MDKKEKQELIGKLFGAAFFIDGITSQKNRKPGQAVQKMSEGDRKKLSELRAEDFNHRQK